MASNDLPPKHLACKCLNIRLQAYTTQDLPPPVEAGFNAVYVGEEGIRIAHTVVTLRSRSKAVPVSDSPTAELTRYTTVTCLVCGLLTYRVAQRITPDLSTEEGPVLPTDDWVEKELCKSSTGWIEVYQDCLTDNEISQAELSPMYSQLFHVVLPGGTPPTAASQSSEDKSEVQNPRGPSEHGKKHLPELPPLFLPPPFTPSHVVFSYFSAVSAEQSQKLRDQAEEFIAQVTERKVAEVRQAETALKQEIELVWGRFMESLKLYEQTVPVAKASLPLRRRGSVSGHVRSVSGPAQGAPGSVRINNFVPTPNPSPRTSPTRPALHSALSASLKTSGMHYPLAQQQVNGNGNADSSQASPSSPTLDHDQTSPERSSVTRVHSPSTASSRTAAPSIDGETSIRVAHRREMDESKDIATSFRYVLDLEAQIEQQRLQAEAEVVSPPVTSPAPVAEGSVSTAAHRSSRVHRSAIKHTSATDRSKSPKDKTKEATTAEEQKEGSGKGKRKVTFDVKPEVAIIRDEGEPTYDQATPTDMNEDAIFDMDNESEHSASTRVEPQVEPTKSAPAPIANCVRTPPRPSHSRSSSNSGLPPQLSSLRPASLPAPSAMRPPQRHPTPPSVEAAGRSRALRESLVVREAQRDVVDSPVEITPQRHDDSEEPLDPREAELLRLVAASTPSHRSAWKKNSKAWQVFLSRRERRAGAIGPEPISEEGNYVLDDFDPQAGRHFNGIPDSDVTDDDDTEDDKWANGNDLNHPIAQSLPIPIGPLNQHRQTFGVPQYQPKTSLSDRPGMLVPPLRNNSTSSSLPRASYTERDRVRPADPGAFAFAADNDDDDDDEDVESDPETGGKARQRALKILKARNEMPAAGMWRSLV